MYKGVLDQNWIRDLFRSIGYPIGPPSKIYEDNQATIEKQYWWIESLLKPYLSIS